MYMLLYPRLPVVCLQGYTQVYLPFFSDMAADRRKRVRDGTLGDASRPGGPGSMWNNIDDAAKRGKR